MSVLHLHTVLLELLDWDEDALDEAASRTREIASECSEDGVNVNARDLKKKLSEEYPIKIVDALVDFFSAVSELERQVEEQSEEEMASWEDFVVRRGINFEDFKKKNGIKSANDLKSYCDRLGVTHPGESQLSSLFPSKVNDFTDLDFEEVVDEDIKGAKPNVESVEIESDKKQEVNQTKKKKNKGV